MIDVNKSVNESEGEFIYRICSNKDAIGSWIDIAKILNHELGYEYTESKYRKDFQVFNRMFKDNESKFVDSDRYVNSIREEKESLQKERYKLQTEKLEYNNWLRENARDELIVEKIVDSIKRMPPFEYHVVKEKHDIDDNKEYVLIFGDEHYGAEFVIKDLKGNIINEYNPEIFEKRMWDLLDKTVEIIDKNKINTLHVFSVGDFTDGVLRIGQLMKLRYGVVDGTVKYMEFISGWLNRLTDFVNVKFYMVNGNHSELRFFNQPKGAFKDENMGKIVESYIKARLETNVNFEFIENPSNLIYAKIAGYNVVGIHGEMKDMEKAIKDLSNTYNVPIDYLIGGHLHHAAYETVGINKGVIRVPSIVGVDDFSLTLNKTSCAGASIIELTQNEGKTTEYTINLQ